MLEGEDMKVGLNEIPMLASKMIKSGVKYPIWLFIGDLGTGKTTLIKELVRQMGIREPVKSPTFNIVHEYGEDEQMLYHFDFYRLKDREEAIDIGVEEYFFSGHKCFIEWPELVLELIPEPYMIIKIEHLDDQFRKYIFLDHEQKDRI